MLIPLLMNNLMGGATCTVTGTATTALAEADLIAGGETIILTLAGDTWVAAGPTFDSKRQDIIDGITSAGSELTGWNNEIRDKEVVTAVVRTSDSVVTVTLTASAAYDITANETITVTVPATVVVGSNAIVATPPITAYSDTIGGWSGDDYELLDGQIIPGY